MIDGHSSGQWTCTHPCHCTVKCYEFADHGFESFFLCTFFGCPRPSVEKENRRDERETKQEKIGWFIEFAMCSRQRRCLNSRIPSWVTFSSELYVLYWPAACVYAVRHVHTCTALSKQLGNHRSMHLANGIMLSNWMHFSDVRQPTTHWVYDHDAYDKLMMHQRTRSACHTLTTHMNIGNEIVETVDEMKFIRFFM